MREFFKSAIFKILLGVIAVFLAFILYEASTGNISSPSQLIGVIASPFKSLASTISNGFSSLTDPLVNANEYKKENEELKQQITDLNEKLIDYEKIKAENDQLKEIADIKEINPDYDLEPANVISRDASDPFCSFQINKGSLNGIEVGDVVMTSQGLVGQVDSVALTYSHVITILNPELYISAYEVTTQSAGVVNGEISLAEQGMCQMLHLDKETKIEEGSIVTTAGSSGVFPASLQIGTVQKISVQENGISAYAEIEPMVDIEKVNDVLVIKSFTGQGVSRPDGTNSSANTSSGEG